MPGQVGKEDPTSKTYFQVFSRNNKFKPPFIRPTRKLLLKDGEIIWTLLLSSLRGEDSFLYSPTVQSKF